MLRLHADHHRVGLQAVVERHLMLFAPCTTCRLFEDDAGVDDHDARAALRLALGGHVGVRASKDPRTCTREGAGSSRRRRPPWGRLLRLQCLLHQELDVGRSQAPLWCE